LSFTGLAMPPKPFRVSPTGRTSDRSTLISIGALASKRSSLLSSSSSW
jgi:hypothetical protein